MNNVTDIYLTAVFPVETPSDANVWSLNVASPKWSVSLNSCTCWLGRLSEIKSKPSLLDLSWYRHLKNTLLHFSSSPVQTCLTGLREGEKITHRRTHTHHTHIRIKTEQTGEGKAAWQQHSNNRLDQFSPPPDHLDPHEWFWSARASRRTEAWG